MRQKYFTMALLVPLTGCALWKDFKQPETETPSNWKNEPGQAEKVWPDADWWKQFGSDPLTGMVEEANRSNYDLKAAVARVREADAQVRISGAALLPSVEADAGASHVRTPGSSSSTALSSKARLSNNYNASLNASYEVDFWGKNWSAAESARLLAEASRYDQETVYLTVSSSVATTYFDVLATQERLAVAKENLANAEQLLGSIRTRFELGVATALDVAQQESVAATQRATVPPLEQHLQQDLDALAILLGKMPENVVSPEEQLDHITLPRIVAGLPSELLERRPDVQSAEAQLASLHASVISARAQFFPSIGLTAGAGYESAALAQLFRPESMLFSLGASLAQPIFEGGLLRGQLDLEKARYDEALQNYRKAVLAAFSDVEDALIAAQKTAAEEEAQQIAVETARRAYDLTQLQMQGGIVDITTVLNTQRTLFSAQDALVQAKLAHLQAIVGVYKALGGGWKNEHPLAPVVVPVPAPAQTPIPDQTAIPVTTLDETPPVSAAVVTENKPAISEAATPLPQDNSVTAPPAFTPLSATPDAKP